MGDTVKLQKKIEFVNEAVRIVKAEGVVNLSARTLAQSAGLNASAIYTYFHNMHHLEALACIAITREYLAELEKGYEACSLWIQRYVTMWELFLKHAFVHPQEFIRVYYPTETAAWTYNLYEEYFGLFPEQSIVSEQDILAYLHIGSAQRGYHRDHYILSKAAREGSVEENAVDFVAHMNIAYSYYIIRDIINGRVGADDQGMYEKSIQYMCRTLLPHTKEEHRSFLLDKIADNELS